MKKVLRPRRAAALSSSPSEYGGPINIRASGEVSAATRAAPIMRGASGGRTPIGRSAAPGKTGLEAQS